MTRFADHFSNQAEGYARYRPTYPATLYEALAERTPGWDVAWDCATGNGQVAVALTNRFETVVATEPSLRQLAHRQVHDSVRYVRCTAQACALADRSADLVTVGQALHWFAGDEFFGEVRRVLKPGGLVAAWGYGLCTVTPEIDEMVLEFCDAEPGVGSYWPPERRFLDEEYETLPFPFTPVEVPAIVMVESWTVDALLGYFDTWSAIQRYRQTEERDPLPDLALPLRRAWGEGRRPVRWPLYLLAGRV